MTTVGELLLRQQREMDEYERIRKDLALEIRISPAVQQAAEAIVRSQRQVQEQLRPMLQTIEELNRSSGMVRLQEAMREMAERHQAMLESFRFDQMRINTELFERSRLMAEELEKSVAFPSVAQLAHEAAILRYPWLERDPSECPEHIDLEADVEDEVSAPTPYVSRPLRDMVLSAMVSGFVSGLLPLILSSGGDVHIHNTTIINLKSPAPARIAPHGKAQEIERLPEGTKILTLGGGDRWCPVWPVGPVSEPQGGWIFRKHVEEVK